MTHFDVFNGDADGICALHQLRLVEPLNSVLVTGVKRDIALLARVNANKGDSVTALDISLSKNKEALNTLLNKGVEVQYFDHHHAGEIPQHWNLQTFIDTRPDICTSLLVDQFLNGQQRIWAVTAAFGDNMPESAQRAAAPLHLGAKQLNQLRQLGEYLNYNAYGEVLEDLYYPPAELYTVLHRYPDPYAFIAEEPAFKRLKDGFAEDTESAKDLRPELLSGTHAVYILPDAGWSRRVNGVFSNHLAASSPARAHAILACLSGGGYIVSVRAPLKTKTGADDLCRRFETGGGRQAAAGINHLPEDKLTDFIKQFSEAFSS